MSRSPRLLPSGLWRLIRHSTTIDPYLDESVSPARRLGNVTLGALSYDALDLSQSLSLTADIRTVARSTLRVPCAITGGASGATFDVAVDGTGAAERRRLHLQPDGSWHVVALRVPRGSLRLTIRVTLTDAAAATSVVCGVPSLTWRKSLRGVSKSLGFAVRTLGVAGTVRHVRTKIDGNPAAQYAAWRACHALDAARLKEARAAAAALTIRPRFALLLEPGDDREAAATRASLDAQVYPEFELVPADGAGARNDALARTTADFIGTIRAGDHLSPLALLLLAQACAGEDVDILYSDEDVWPIGSEADRPRFKPDWSPELLQSGMYLGRMCMIRRNLAAAVGGYRAPLAGALDYDLALRAAEMARHIVHVPDVLYHRAAASAGEPDSAHADAGVALQEACARRSLTATVVPGVLAGLWRARISVSEQPRIAIVIPTDGRGPAVGRPAHIEQCVRGLCERTHYRNYELLVCDNGNLDAATCAYLDTVPHRRVTYHWAGAFNFPNKINFAVRQTSAPYVLLLNDDVEPINAGWLDAMLEYAHQAQVGAVGAKLFYPDGRLQHVGVAVGVCGVAAHLLHQSPGGAQGCGGIAVRVRNCSAVTGACLLTRRQVYEEVGGFDEALALDFNDVDFCLRVGRAGYRIVFTPHARLFHHESASFGTRRQRPGEVAAMWERWGSVLEHDPYYNVNFSRESADCRVRACR